MLSVQLKSNKMNLPGSMVLVFFSIQLGSRNEKEKNNNNNKKTEGRGKEGVAEVRGVRESWVLAGHPDHGAPG